MLALYREHKLEHRTKHIALRYFLARELQQRGQLRLAYVASQANTADIFTKALHVRGPLSGLEFESQCVHFGHPSAGGCQRSTSDPRLILGKGYRHVGLGGYGRTDPLLNKPFYPNGLVVGILTLQPCDHQRFCTMLARSPPLAAHSPSLAARSPPLAARATPDGSPLAAPLQPARRPLATRSPPLCSPRAALWQPARRLIAPRPPPLCSPCARPADTQPAACAARLLPALPCPTHFPSARALPCLRAVLLVARHPALSAMASLSVLTFNHEGRPIQFDTWLDDLQLYLLSNSRDIVLLFDHTSGASLAPPTISDSATRSEWLTQDTAARLAIPNHLLLAERAHFGQHKTAKELYDAVVARYSSPSIVALGCLLLPYLFPELSAFATVEDLVTHLRTSDARYRAALPAEFLDTNPPPMYITLYFIITCLPDSLRTVTDHFLALDPTDLTLDLFEQHLLAAETSVVA
ncbi:unnamed protein product, partial [Closterium sp. NIES-54]